MRNMQEEGEDRDAHTNVTQGETSFLAALMSELAWYEVDAVQNPLTGRWIAVGSKRYHHMRRIYPNLKVRRVRPKIIRHSQLIPAKHSAHHYWNVRKTWKQIPAPRTFQRRNRQGGRRRSNFRATTRSTDRSISKDELLQHLRFNTYVRVAPSKIPGAGVGVIAIRDIPANVDPFTLPGQRCRRQAIVTLTKQEVDALPDHVRRLMHDFIAPNADKTYSMLASGFNTMDTSFYMNNDDQNPNVRVHRSGCQFLGFRTNHIIRQGTELVFRYSQYNEF